MNKIQLKLEFNILLYSKFSNSEKAAKSNQLFTIKMVFCYLLL
jgi:hypothetical protein